MTKPSRYGYRDETTPGLPRWFKLLAIALLIVALLVVVMLVSGGGVPSHVPPRH
jgi:hypothetical protein